MTAHALSIHSRHKRVAIFVTASVAALSLAAAPAIAQKRTPAPIVFAGQGGHNTAPTPQTQTNTTKPRRLSRKERRRAKAAQKAAAQQVETGRRVEFRYPDQPEVYYGEGGGVSSAEGAAPLSFSSSTSAISQAEAAKFTYGEAPVVAPTPAVQSDPAITSGGFDARAAAARSAQKANPSFVSAAGPADFSSAPLNDEPQAVVQSANLTSVTPATRPVSGTPFAPEQDAVYDKTGLASVFHPALNGQATSTGEILDTQTMVAAHPSLPLPSLVQVINLENNREVVVRVNDRGPIDGSGLIEVSERAASVLGFDKTGQANVRVRYLGEAPALSNKPAPVKEQPAQIASPATKAPLFAQTPQQRPSVSPPSYTNNTGQFVVQFASFTDISNAQRMHASLGTQVGNLGIVPAQVNGTDYFRVVSGPLNNRKEAEQLRDRLANQGIGRGLVIAAS